MTSLAILDALFEGLRPPPRLSVSAFAEATLVLPNASNAQPGPLRLAAYQREMLDVIGDPTVHTIVLKLASQTGKSTTIDAALSHFVLNEPSPILVVHPTEAKAKQFIRDRLDPLIAASPKLKAAIGGGRKGSGDSLTFKQFPGGSLATGSAHRPDDLAARAVRVVCLDEVDRFPQSSGQEGSPIDLAIKRTATFRNRKIIVASTPVVRATSRIEAMFARTDQRRFYCSCGECGTFDYLRIERLKWQAGKPETARLLCEDCGHFATESDRIAMVEAGHWQATAEGEPGWVGFHATELVSLFSSMSAVARASDAASTPEQRRTFINTSLGEAVDSDAEVELDPSELQSRAEPIAAPYHEGIVFVTAGIDVQADRLECLFLGVGANLERWVLAHHRIMGDTSGPTVWEQLDRLIGASRFRTRDGRNLPLAATAIDAGYAQSTVVRFVETQRRQQRQVFPVKGTSGFDKPTIRRGSRVSGPLRLYLIGVDMVRLQNARALANTQAGAGAIHLPDHEDDDFFAQLAAERMAVRYVRGHARYAWEKQPGTRNEVQDCLVYATAVATLVRKPPASTPATVAAAPNATIGERAAALHRISNPNGR